MYGKIFESIYDGSLAENWKTMVVFQQFIILADENGIIDLTPEAIARRTNIPLQIIVEAIKELEEPDKESRSSEEDGRRLTKIDPKRGWGWQLVNSGYYRKLSTRQDKLTADRDRIRAKRAVNKGCSKVSQGVAKSRTSDTDTYTDKRKNIKKEILTEIQQKSFALFWKAYPYKKSKGDAERAWKKINPDPELLATMILKLEKAKTSQNWIKDNGEFIPYPASWLNAKGWEDEEIEIAANGTKGTAMVCKGCGDDSQHVSIGEDGLCALCRGKAYDNI